MPPLKVLVVGASIAGPTTAYWLAKAGAKVTVIERFPKLRSNGQNVDIRTVGVSVMKKMGGMEAAVRAKLTPVDGLCFVDTKGRPFFTVTPTGNPDEQSLVSEYEIYRGDLSKILYDMTKDNKNIDYIFGEQVASLQQNEKDETSPITVEFANGSPTSEYDLVVACDGATSRTRAMGFGCGIRDHMKPTNCWAAYFNMKEDLLNGSKMGTAHTAVGGRFFAIGSDPAGGSRGVIMGMSPKNRPENAIQFREAMKKGVDSIKHFITEHYRGAGWKIDELLQCMANTEDFYANEIVDIKAPTLSKGRFVLVGDAGYAGNAGTGTSLAMLGGYLLAGEILKNRGNLSAGLKGYERVIRPIFEDMQKVPSFLPSILAPQTAFGLWLRNSIFAFISWTGILGFVQKYFAPAFASRDKYTIPDYEWVS